MSDLLTYSGARFSPCQRYRYLLWRTWDGAKAPLVWLMLNPSTADAVANDPTVERCQRRTMTMGYGGLLVLNLFALRSTDPKALYTADDPVGPDNDDEIQRCCFQRSVVCAWGSHGGLRRRDRAVLALLRGCDADTTALKVTRGGHPAHPLYLPYTLAPVPFAAAA